MTRLRITYFVALTALLVGLVACRNPSRSSTDRCRDSYRLQYQHGSDVVPKGETWRLSWRSPYGAFEISPAYDVRIIKRAVRLGADGELQANLDRPQLSQSVPLELWATNAEAVIWLFPESEFQIANDLLAIDVSIFSAEEAPRLHN